MKDAFTRRYGDWLAMLLVLAVCGCASLTPDDTSPRPWNDADRFTTPGDYMMQPIVEPPSFGP